MEVDSNCLHPSIISVSWIVNVAFVHLKAVKMEEELVIQAQTIIIPIKTHTTQLIWSLSNNREDSWDIFTERAAWIKLQFDFVPDRHWFLKPRQRPVKLCVTDWPGTLEIERVRWHVCGFLFSLPLPLKASWAPPPRTLAATSEKPAPLDPPCPAEPADKYVNHRSLS